MTMAAAEPWFDRAWLSNHWGDLLRATRDHVLWAAAAFALGLMAAAVLVVIGRRWAAIDRPLRALSLVASAVPAVALLISLAPSITSRIVLVASVGVSVGALIYRGTTHGLDRVDSAVVAEATTLGYGRLSRLRLVELPLAMLAVRSGVRAAAIASVGLVAVGGEALHGGLGQLIRASWVDGPRVQRLSALVLLGVVCVLVDIVVRLVLRPPAATKTRR